MGLRGPALPYCANTLKDETPSLGSLRDTEPTPCVHIRPGCLATRSIARRSTRSCWTETRPAPPGCRLGPHGAHARKGLGGRRGEPERGCCFAGRGGEGRTHEGRSGGCREWLRSRKRASEGAAGWAGREALGNRPLGRGGRAGGEGPKATSARMRNKAVGLARAPPARPTGGLRAGRGGARAVAACGSHAGGRASWPPLGGGVRWPGLSGREVTGLASSLCFGDGPCPPPRSSSSPPEAPGGEATGVPRHVPSRGGVRGRRPSGEVGRPRTAPGTSGRICAEAISKMR